MARITVEQTALSDLRYQTLGRLYKKDRRWALGVMVFIWNQCQEHEKHCLTTDELADIHPDLKGLSDALVQANLATPQEDGSLYIRGTTGRIEWLKERREVGRSANTGRTNKGGRPRKPQGGLEEKPPGGLPEKPPPAPAPAPALKKSPTETKKSSNMTRPDITEIAAYCAERNRGVDPQEWLDHYESNGWRVGKNPMRDWKAAVRTWERSCHLPSLRLRPGHVSKEYQETRLQEDPL